MNYSLPTSITIDDKEYEIRSDFRAILDICTALTDCELTSESKAEVLLHIFYPEWETIPLTNWREAIQKCFDFININRTSSRRAPKLMDWEQDFDLIVAPVNRVIGQEIRALPYLHWWTFISAYNEIGDCTFAQVIRIRELKAKHKQLDKFDKEWYKDHRELVDFKMSYTEAENELLKQWGV